MRNPVQCNFHSILAPELYGFLDYREANGHTGSDERYMMWRYYLSEVVLRCDL